MIARKRLESKQGVSVLNFKMVMAMLAVFLAAACGASKTAVPATATNAPPQATLAPATQDSSGAAAVVELAGDTWFNSEAIKVSSDATLKITWNYSGQGPFALWLVNTAEEVLDPNYDRILIANAEGTSSGSVEHLLIPGEYEVQVEVADGPWTVDVRPIEP
jgi:hypothetical protein